MSKKFQNAYFAFKQRIKPAGEKIWQKIDARMRYFKHCGYSKKEEKGYPKIGQNLQRVRITEIL